ncbi:hypothetical protein [Porphyromonas sp.]
MTPLNGLQSPNVAGHKASAVRWNTMHRRVVFRTSSSADRRSSPLLLRPSTSSGEGHRPLLVSTSTYTGQSDDHY